MSLTAKFAAFCILADRRGKISRWGRVRLTPICGAVTPRSLGNQRGAGSETWPVQSSEEIFSTKRAATSLMTRGLTAGPYRLPLYFTSIWRLRRWNLNLPRTFTEFPAKAKNFPCSGAKNSLLSDQGNSRQIIENTKKSRTPVLRFCAVPCKFPC